MSNLFHFLTELATSPKGQELFLKDPEAMMATTQLSEADKTLLKSRDQTKVAALFAQEYPQLAKIGTDPGPDPLPDPDPPSYTYPKINDTSRFAPQCAA